MKILFVDDVYDQVSKAVLTLRKSGLFSDVSHVGSYDAITETQLRETSLFVLDVFVDGGERNFLNMIRQLQGKRPFIAYTTATEHYHTDEVPGRPAMRETVLQHGGLAMITKDDNVDVGHARSRLDIQLDLAQLVINYYWTQRSNLAI